MNRLSENKATPYGKEQDRLRVIVLSLETSINTIPGDPVMSRMLPRLTLGKPDKKLRSVNVASSRKAYRSTDEESPVCRSYASPGIQAVSEYDWTNDVAIRVPHREEPLRNATPQPVFAP
jgi:hypothetical protein